MFFRLCTLAPFMIIFLCGSFSASFLLMYGKEYKYITPECG
jgi:hypothetical protein